MSTSTSITAGQGFLPLEAASVQFQTVLFKNDLGKLHASLVAIAGAVRQASSVAGLPVSAVVSYGDATPEPLYTESQVREIQDEFAADFTFSYTWFNENTGSARGHNLLAQHAQTDFLFLINPDVIFSPKSLGFMLELFAQPGTGIVDAKQIPIEHPKNSDPVTGETSWVSGACTLIPRVLFERVEGYDAESFFMYCDDVDLAWRVRAEGYKAIHQPAAVAFHEKEIGQAGEWVPTEAEKYYSAEAALLLAHKWSRDDLVKKIENDLANSGVTYLERAVEVFRSRRREGSLPVQRDSSHEVGQFIRGNYADHRFVL